MEEFLVNRLDLYKTQGLRGGIFTDGEVTNVFNLFDLKKEGSITKDRCIKGIFLLNIIIAIQTMANSSFQFNHEELKDIPDKVDLKKFKDTCGKVFGTAEKSFLD
jgi:hypothetical protein